MEEEKNIIGKFIEKAINLQISRGTKINQLDQNKIKQFAINEIIRALNNEENIASKQQLERACRDFEKYFLGIFKNKTREQEIKIKEIGIVRNFIRKEINLQISRGINVDKLDKNIIKENAKNKMLMPLQDGQVNMNEKIRNQLNKIGECFDEVFDPIFEDEVIHQINRERGKIKENVYYFNPHPKTNDTVNNDSKKLKYITRYSKGMEM